MIFKTTCKKATNILNVEMVKSFQEKEKDVTYWDYYPKLFLMFSKSSKTTK